MGLSFVPRLGSGCCSLVISRGLFSVTSQARAVWHSAQSFFLLRGGERETSQAAERLAAASCSLSLRSIGELPVPSRPGMYSTGAVPGLRSAVAAAGLTAMSY